jgi:hypothetical protein
MRCEEESNDEECMRSCRRSEEESIDVECMRSSSDEK